MAGGDVPSPDRVLLAGKAFIVLEVDFLESDLLSDGSWISS